MIYGFFIRIIITHTCLCAASTRILSRLWIRKIGAHELLDICTTTGVHAHRIQMLARKWRPSELLGKMKNRIKLTPPRKPVIYSQYVFEVILSI